MEEEKEEEDILGELARSYFSEMSIENKVAGLFMVTPEAITGVRTATQAGDGTQEALNAYA
ncbi:MAG: beta-N-acetylhexosaminidase, partial [Acetatifactor sp.]|nr:beta-N-acetylhexosaminidase [Acetatifactor sp.]